MKFSVLVKPHHTVHILLHLTTVSVRQHCTLCHIIYIQASLHLDRIDAIEFESHLFELDANTTATATSLSVIHKHDVRRIQHTTNNTTIFVNQEHKTCSEACKSFILTCNV